MLHSLAGKPSAFSISQQIIDEVLTSGGNELDSALRIAAYFKKDHTTAENADFLQKEYRRFGNNGKGFIFGGNHVSVWFTEKGIRIATGDTALNTEYSTLVTWEQAARRIRELLDMGRFMQQSELDRVDGHEIKRLADELWYTHQDRADNLNNALNTWNEKLSEIWNLITQSPETFKGGGIWNVIVNIHGAVQAIGLGLLVLFFVVGMMKTFGSFAEMKRPEVAVKVFIRFALAKAAVTYGLELMMALFRIVQGLMSTIMGASGVGGGTPAVLPQEIVDSIENVSFLQSIPLWAVTLIGGLFITVLSFIMIMSVYGRFFKLYLYTAIAPVPLAAFAGEPS